MWRLILLIPHEIEEQIKKSAIWYARELPRTAGPEFPATPTWLSEEAENWIRKHYFEFSDLVLEMRRAETATPDT